MSEQAFVRPFPALTPAQRYKLDVLGYVVIENTLTADEAGETHEALLKLRADIKAVMDPNKPTEARVRGAHFRGYQPHNQYIATMYEADPAITRYCCHPRLVGMAEELIGCKARILETAGIINKRIPGEVDVNASNARYGFHQGTPIPPGSHIQNGLYHCHFVKTLTNLTELGPDDGGTVVIAGSHKINAPVQDMINTAYQDRSLIHQVIAPAGSTLLFSETLIHATGHLRSDRERAIIICGYGPMMFPDWSRGDGKHLYPTPQFDARIPESMKHLFHGRAHWGREEKYRNLADPVDTTPIEWPKWLLEDIAAGV
jgi:ectoine hydroxylase-related dioxygenase (phytanoyl-CoA dioxygenase family)